MDQLSFSLLVESIGFGPAVRVCEARLTNAFFDQISFSQCMEGIEGAESPSELRTRFENAAARKAANPDECRALLKAHPNREALTVVLDRLLATATCMADCQPAVTEWGYKRRDEAMTVALRLCAGKDEALAAYKWSAPGERWKELVVEKALSYATTTGECLAIIPVRSDRYAYSDRKEPIRQLPLKRALELAKTTAECLAVENREEFNSSGIKDEAKEKGVRLARTTDDCLLLVHPNFSSMDDAALKKGIRLAKRTEECLAILEKLQSQQRDVRVKAVRRRALDRAIGLARTGEERVAVLRACPYQRVGSSAVADRAEALDRALAGAHSIADWKLVWNELTHNPHRSSLEERAQALAAAARFVADEDVAVIPKILAG